LASQSPFSQIDCISHAAPVRHPCRGPAIERSRASQIRCRAAVMEHSLLDRDCLNKE